MKDVIVIHDITSESEWKNIFEVCINHCNKFDIIFTEDKLDEDNRFITGKKEFKNLRNVTIKPWDGMDNSIIISGSLDSEARKLIYKYTSPSFEGGVNDLWHYNIYKDDILFLGIQDFSVCLLENHAGVLELLKDIGVDPQTLED